MAKYKFTLTGKSIVDNKFYTITIFSEGMSPYERELLIKKERLDPKTTKLKKEKVK